MNQRKINRGFIPLLVMMASSLIVFSCNNSTTPAKTTTVISTAVKAKLTEGQLTLNGTAVAAVTAGATLADLTGSAGPTKVEHTIADNGTFRYPTGDGEMANYSFIVTETIAKINAGTDTHGVTASLHVSATHPFVLITGEVNGEAIDAETGVLVNTVNIGNVTDGDDDDDSDAKTANLVTALGGIDDLAAQLVSGSTVQVVMTSSTLDTFNLSANGAGTTFSHPITGMNPGTYTTLFIQLTATDKAIKIAGSNPANAGLDTVTVDIGESHTVPYAKNWTVSE